MSTNEIVEPVSEIHRFPGQFIHVANEKVYYLDRESNREGWWALVSRCLTSREEQFRLTIPAGDIRWCVDHFIVVGVREIVAISLEGKVEWRFTLPGKPDSRESLLGIVGNDLGKVFIASQFNENPEKKGQSYCRVFAFERDSGRLIDCMTFAVQIPHPQRPLIDLETKELFWVSVDQVICFDLATGREKWNRKTQESVVPQIHRSLSYRGSVIHCDKQIMLLNQYTNSSLIPASATAPSAIHDGILYAPIQADGSSSFALQSIPTTSTIPLPTAPFPDVPVASAPRGPVARSLQESPWKTALPAAVTVKPVVTKESVYVVAGQTLYRLDRVTGTVCWKKHFPMKEEITDVQLNGNELWLTGQGFLARVQNEKESAEAEPKAIPPAE